MKKPALLALVSILGLGALVVAQEARTAFKSKDGSLTLAPIGQFRISQKPGQIAFSGKGKGLTTVYNDLSVRADALQGVASRSGSVVTLKTMQTQGPTTSVFTNADGKVTCLSQALGYTKGTPDQIDLSGAVTIENSEAKVARSTKMSGQEGTVWIDGTKKGRDQMRKAVLNGPVKIELRQAAVGGKGATKIDASGSRLDYLATATGAQMTLKGSVKIAGDGDTFSGTGEANEVVVRFNAAGEVEEVEMLGEPATTLLNQKGGGR